MTLFHLNIIQISAHVGRHSPKMEHFVRYGRPLRGSVHTLSQFKGDCSI